MVGNFPTIFRVFDRAGSINDEHGSAEASIQRAALDQDAVIFAKLRASVSAQGFDLVDALSSAPSLLTERKVHADNQHFDVRE